MPELLDIYIYLVGDPSQGIPGAYHSIERIPAPDDDFHRQEIREALSDVFHIMTGRSVQIRFSDELAFGEEEGGQ